jgi:hypothetical protein
MLARTQRLATVFKFNIANSLYLHQRQRQLFLFNFKRRFPTASPDTPGRRQRGLLMKAVLCADVRGFDVSAA